MLRKSPDRQELLFAGESPSRLKWHQCLVSVGPLGRRIGFRRSSRQGLAQPLATSPPFLPAAVPVAELPPAVLLPAEPDVLVMSNSITSPLVSQVAETIARPTTGVVEVDQHRALAAAAQKGDRKAFAALVEIYQQTVYGFLRARLLEPSDAEDLCQEVFLRCYVGHEKLARATSVGPWLIGIARNLLREHVRRACRRKEVAWTELCLELDALVQDQASHSDEAVAQLPQCLQSLGQSAREAIDLRYRSQLRWSEIGTRLKRSEGAVKLLMHRARQALRNCLDRKLKVSL